MEHVIQVPLPPLGTSCPSSNSPCLLHTTAVCLNTAWLLEVGVLLVHEDSILLMLYLFNGVLQATVMWVSYLAQNLIHILFELGNPLRWPV